MKLLFKLGCVLAMSLLLVQPGWSLTEPDLRDAILEKIPATSDMDLNEDGKVDVADLVKFISGTESLCNSLAGEHIGTFYRDGGKLIQGRSASTGQISFALKITGDSSLTGEINNQPDPDNPMGYYSLYFPADRIPVTLRQPDENSLEFEFDFITGGSNLSPDNPLNRNMKFSGQFTDADKRVLSGTYEESVSGFQDNQGNEIPISFKGSFMMVLECGN